MKKIRVLLIDLGVGANTSLLPLGSGLVGSYLKDCLDKKNIPNEIDLHLFMPSDEEIKTISKSYDIIGFATYVWNINNSLSLAKKLKEKNSDIINIFGGYSIPKPGKGVFKFFEDNFYVDYIVHGEGEKPLQNLVEKIYNIKFKNENLQLDLLPKSVSGKDLGILKNSKVPYKVIEAKEIFDRLPEIKDNNHSPFLNGLFDKLLKKYKNKISGALIETDRGCPYSCVFCDWGDSNLNKIKVYNLERLKLEFEWIGKNKINYIFNCNANFGIMYQRDLEIAKILADVKKKYGFPKYFTTNWLKNSHEKIINIARILQSAGITTDITLSVQSLNERTLEIIKRKNLTDEKMFLLKKIFHDEKIPTYTELILPLPEETYETMKSNIGRLMKFEDLGYFIFYSCSILINTEMAEKEYIEKYQIKTVENIVPIARKTYTDAWKIKENDSLVVQTSSMTTVEWKKTYKLLSFAMIFYNYRVMYKTLKFMLENLKIEPIDVISNFVEFAENLDHKKVMYKINEIIDRQTESILAGQGSTSSLNICSTVKLQAYECGFVEVISNKNQIKNEIFDFLKKFCSSKLDKKKYETLKKIIDLEIELLPDKSKNEIHINIDKDLEDMFNLKIGKYKINKFYENELADEIFYSTLIKGGRRVTFKQISAI